MLKGISDYDGMKLPHIFKKHNKKTLIIMGLFAFIVVILLVSTGVYYLRSKPAKPALPSEYIRSLQANQAPNAKPIPAVPSVAQSAQMTYDQSKTALKGKTSFQKSDLTALVNLATSAQVLGKTAEAQSAANSALTLIKAQPDFAKQYPSVVASLEVITK